MALDWEFSRVHQLKFSKLEHQNVLVFVKVNSVKKNNKQKALKLKPQVNHTIWVNRALINKDKGVAQFRGALDHKFIFLFMCNKNTNNGFLHMK